MSISPLFQLSTDQDYHLTLKMASAQVVETSVTNNSPSQDSNHPDDCFQSRYLTPGFIKPFSYYFTAGYGVQLKFEGLNTYFFEVQTLI